MRRAVILSFLMAASLSIRAQERTNVSAQEKLLLDAHNSKSEEKLSAFFENWQQEIPTITKKELRQMNDTLREAYHVFTAFYHIKQLKALGGFRNKIENFYDEAKFLVIQNNLDLHITDQVYWTEAEADSIATASVKNSNLSDHYKRGYLARPNGKLGRLTIGAYGPTSDRNKLHLVNDKALGPINNFRPAIDEGDKQAVYLSDDHKKLLNSFLGNDSHLITGRDSITLKYLKDLPFRLKFIETHIRLLRWSGFHLHSGPYIRKITLDKNLKYARVDYEIWAEGGEAFLKNDNGKWVLISATRLWIE